MKLLKIPPESFYILHNRYQLRNLMIAACLLAALVYSSFPANNVQAAVGTTGFAVSLFPQSASDTSLAAVRQSDRASRKADGGLARLSPIEHLRRANVYISNRAFAEAREHWQALLTFYPKDVNLPAALFGIGKSYFQERRYREALPFFARVAKTYPQTKDGREGLNFSAAAALRSGKPDEAAERYQEYVEGFPNGERIDTAHLNLIDTLREAGQPKAAIQWIARTRERFANSSTETNAIFCRLRLDVAEGNWKHAVATADELRTKSFQKGVLTTTTEVAYLKAYSLEQAGQRQQAIDAYLAIPDSLDSYYGWLATERLQGLANGTSRTLANQRTDRVGSQIEGLSSSYPAPYREIILRNARKRKLDPRFVLAIIKQESVFQPLAKSPSGARGLLQLTIDAAQRYAAAAGFEGLRESQLYRPETSIAVGEEYIADLCRMFPNLLEAVAASYNGGEDNVARWVKRAKQNDRGVFTAEIGFDETKPYVQKVMSNYRAYRQLYTIDLARK